MNIRKCKICNCKNPDTYDGNPGVCKGCYKKRARANREKKLEYYRAYDRQRADLPERIKSRKEVAERWRKDPKLRKKSAIQKKKWAIRNAEKRAAHVILGHALRAKKVFKMPCKICGNKKSDGHHYDYTKPLEVIWLCKKHHGEHHRILNERNRL